MSRDWSYRVWDKQEKTYSDKAFSIDQHGIPYVQDEDGYWEEASARYVFEFSTGLKDMNGKMIREGDIVSYLKSNYEIYFDKVQGWRGIRRGTHSAIPIGETVYNMTINPVGKPEVIGNIHENPELIGGEE